MYGTGHSKSSGKTLYRNQEHGRGLPKCGFAPSGYGVAEALEAGDALGSVKPCPNRIQHQGPQSLLDLCLSESERDRGDLDSGVRCKIVRSRS